MTRVRHTALVLSGGGARAAYQVGVLRALAEVRRDIAKTDDVSGEAAALATNPFPIICGTSAGAINAATLAVHADDFDEGVSRLCGVWGEFRAHHVYRTDIQGVLGAGLRWLAVLVSMGLYRKNPISLLDNAPLKRLLARALDLKRIREHLESGVLNAVSITASGYTSGQSVSFFQARATHKPWQRHLRIGIPAEIRVEHLMASSAIPFVFPAVCVNREYFGDGSMRQIAPISPALHLGATRVLVIGTGQLNVSPPRVKSAFYPSLAQIAGHVMNSIFLDSLAVDLERLQRINNTLSLIPAEIIAGQGTALKPVEVLVFSPSTPLSSIAVKHVKALPRTIRILLRSIGAMRRNGSNLASYLLFERDFCRAIMDMGYGDAMARREEIVHFFEADKAK